MISGDTIQLVCNNQVAKRYLEAMDVRSTPSGSFDLPVAR